MRFRRRNKTGAESQKALEDAEKNLAEVHKRTPEVNHIAKALKDIRERNHFGEQLEAIIIRGRTP